ncbi:hypothetical protein E4U13_007933 [Claviceps humidiphila]|uniref:Uncharacterized protein n=1 Tax=Claviceps humidiphila TaxID=1294629 RepID=A0A9P7TWG6_9HYPO|nr:hypothetical protein E4U13_007933 [Claviceps humidiphila]
MSTIDLDKDFIDEGGEEFGPKELVAAFITQLYSAMVRKGLQYGYIDTGEAMVFLHIGDDISRVEYHLSCPRSDVRGDDKKMHLSAVSQLFAFVVQAIQAPNITKDWEIAATELPIWNEQYVNPLKDVMSSFEVPEEKSDPYKSSSSLDETAGHKTVITRTASKSAHQPPDDVSNEEV